MTPGRTLASVLVLAAAAAACELPREEPGAAPEAPPRRAASARRRARAAHDPGGLTGVPSSPIAPTPTWLVPAIAPPGAQAARQPAAPQLADRDRDVVLRERVVGTWRNERSEPGSTHECTLEVRADSARETCRSVETPPPPGVTLCRAPFGSHVRSTAAPYWLNVENGELVFRPGTAVVESDNACDQRPAGTHTLMRGHWDGEGDVLELGNFDSVNNTSLGTITYTRPAR